MYNKDIDEILQKIEKIEKEITEIKLEIQHLKK